MHKALTLASLVCWVSLSHGYPSGAPNVACGTMFPNHGYNSREDSPPFNIRVNATTYTKTQNITVTLTALLPSSFVFEGFFLQARRADCSNYEMPIGRFFQPKPDPEIQLITCPGRYALNAATHTTASKKITKTVTWNNPEGNDVFFQVTFVHEKDIFWSNVQSKVVYDASMGGMGRTYDACKGKTMMKEGMVLASGGNAVTASMLLGIAAFRAALMM